MRIPFDSQRPATGLAFVGRDRVVHELLLHLRDRVGVAILGGHGTGKTSVMLALRDRLKAAGCFVVYLGLGSDAEDGVAAVATAVAAACGMEIHEHRRPLAQLISSSLDFLFSNGGTHDHIWLMVDGLHKLSAPALARLFSALREPADQGFVTLTLGGRDELWTEVHNSESVLRHLLGDLKEMLPLQLNDVEQLIEVARGAGFEAPREVAPLVLELTCGHPWRLQYLLRQTLTRRGVLDIQSLTDVMAETRMHQEWLLTRFNDRSRPAVEGGKPGSGEQFHARLSRVNTYAVESGIDAPSTFISYAWGNSEHESWVERLAGDLDRAGIPVIWDRRHNAQVGMSIPRFVDRAASAQRVVVVGTPSYRSKYDNDDARRGFVVAAEGDLIGRRLLGTEGQKASVLPALLEGTEEGSFPPLLQGRVYADFRRAERYCSVCIDFVLQIYNIDLGSPFAASIRYS